MINESALKNLAMFTIALGVSYIFFKSYFLLSLVVFCILILLDFYEITWIFIFVIPIGNWMFKHWDQTVTTFKEMYPSIILILVVIVLLKLYVDTKD